MSLLTRSAGLPWRWHLRPWCMPHCQRPSGNHAGPVAPGGEADRGSQRRGEREPRPGHPDAAGARGRAPGRPGPRNPACDKLVRGWKVAADSRPARRSVRCFHRFSIQLACWCWVVLHVVRGGRRPRERRTPLWPVHYTRPPGHRVGGMALRLVQIAMNARDDSAVGRFWAEALDWGISSEEPGVTNVEPVGFVYPDPVAVCIDVIAVPEPKTVKNRVHIDLATTSAAHQADLVARLRDLGATPADVGQGDVPWTVLADPEGNEFCVLAPWPGGRDTGPVAAVTVDCADPRAMARFWGQAMDWTLHQVTDDHAVLRSAKGVGPYLQFLRTPDVKTVKNRVHLDLRPYPGDDQEAEVARLRTLGATDIDLGQGDVPWTCLADPEGNEFDVLTPR